MTSKETIEADRLVGIINQVPPPTSIGERLCVPYNGKDGARYLTLVAGRNYTQEVVWFLEMRPRRTKSKNADDQPSQP